MNRHRDGEKVLMPAFRLQHFFWDNILIIKILDMQNNMIYTLKVKITCIQSKQRYLYDWKNMWNGIVCAVIRNG